MQVVLILRWPSTGNWGPSVRSRTRDGQITRLLEPNQKLLTKNSTKDYWPKTQLKTFEQKLLTKNSTKNCWPKTSLCFPLTLPSLFVAKLSIQRTVESILNHDIWGRFHDTCVFMWVLIKEKSVGIFLEYIYCHTAGEKGKVKYLEVNM